MITRLEIQLLVKEEKKKRNPPKPNEIIQILHLAIIEKHPYNFISKKHNVSEKSISVFVNKAKKNQKFLKELYSKEIKLTNHSNQIKDCIHDILSSAKVISTVKAV